MYLGVLVSFIVAADLQVGSVGRWKVNSVTDPMTDKVTVALVLQSEDGATSLRVTCSDDGEPSVLMTLPGSTPIEPDALTLAEIRFDKEEPEGYILQEMHQDFLVSALGGSKDTKNVAVMSNDPSKLFGSGLQREQVVAAGRAFIAGLRRSTRIAYAFPLLAAGRGTRGTMANTGFAAVSKRLARCLAQ